jgi:exportin-1
MTLTAVAFEIVNNFASSSTEIANQFYAGYLLNLLGDVFFVVTDPDHKSQFKASSLLLARLISLVETDQVKVPLFDPAIVGEGMTNQIFLKKYVADLLQRAFSHMQM